MSTVIDFEARRAKRAISERRATTDRGEMVIDSVFKATQRLLIERWSHDLSVAEIAGAAGIARASLLLQFPGGMTDVFNTVAIRELGIFDEGCEAAMLANHRKPVERVIAAFEPLFSRAEHSGRLYANLRGAMFTWGAENQSVFRCGFQDYVDMTSKLITGNPITNEPGHARQQGYIAEVVFNTALDIASMEGEWWGNWIERREAFRKFISILLAEADSPSNKKAKNKKRATSRRR
jgi:AcrR family transcriptional regulator